MTKLLLIAMLVLLAAWLWIRARGRKEQTQPALAVTQDSPYSAVSIRGSIHACDRAKQLAGERFLSSNPPELPLAGCDASKCECYFVSHDDRRKGFDRRSPFNPNTHNSGTGMFEQERRQAIDRRKAS